MFQNDSIIWYGNPAHIFKWNIRNKSLRAYNSEIDTDFQYGVHESAIAKDKLEKMYFGSTNGLITYDSKADFLKVTAPETQITKFDLYNMGNDFIANYYNALTYNGIPQNIKLPYNKNNIKIEFIGLDYSYPCKFDCLEKYGIHYSYKLEGYDKEWHTTTDKEVIFSALRPGNYTFLLKARSSEGIWNKEPVEYSFTISPPWWETWWYYLAQVAILLALILITIYFNHSQSQTRIATILAFVTLLIVIEFLAFHVEAYFESFTGEIPLYKLGVNLVLALLVAPVEKTVDKWVKKRDTLNNDKKSH